MTFILPELKYAQDALEPHISAETMQYHYGKHHQTYVDKLNLLVKGTPLESVTLEEIITTSTGGIFNNAAQVWNHTFYWNCLAPNAGGKPTGKVLELIEDNFGSFEEFQKEFDTMAINNFGSSWTWLVQTSDEKLEIVNTSNADNPLTKKDLVPILVVDLWEHAYYIDRRNARPSYLDAFWKLVNWNFAEKNLK